MRRITPPLPAVICMALALAAASPMWAALINRYSFNDDAGAAPAGTAITDSVGGADGAIIGAGGAFTGTSLSLPGGPGATSDSAYVDLPNGLLSAHETVTFEAWYTLNGSADGWARIWDFGSSATGEILGTNAGNNQGQDYFLFAPMRGTNVNQQRYTIRNLDPAAPAGGVGPVDGDEEAFDTNLATALGTEYHVAGVWEHDGFGGGTLRFYRDGELQGDRATTFSAADINDVNNWLGRSNWTGDGYLNGELNEFRIYDAALSDVEVRNSFNAGPDVIVSNEDSDNDGLPNTYEESFDFLNPNDPDDAGMDQEPDGLTNLEEFNAGTNPDDEDSDDDGLNDGDEVNTHGTQPRNPDTDDDGLADGAEVNTHGSDPNLVDTDSDGLNDGVEVAGGIDPTSADATAPNLLHRYSFSQPAGPADAGASVVDSTGGADGNIVGAGGMWTGTALTLPGGDGATADAAYVDLPNGLLSAHGHVTFEAWYTLRSAASWTRVWDFGSSDGGEIGGTMTGNTQGQDYFIFAPNRGANISQQRYTVRNLDPAAPGGGTGPVDADEEALDTNLESFIDQEYHVAGVWTSDGNGGAQLVLYRDGLPGGSRTTTFAPPDINDVNNWLGRSNWTGDAYFNGDLNEFRIYEGAMNNAAAADSFAAGPDAALGGLGFVITDIIYNADTKTVDITWNSVPGAFYIVWASSDAIGWGDLDDAFPSQGETTTYPGIDASGDTLLLRVERGQ